MTRTEMEYQIWHNLGYLEAKTPSEYQEHLWKLSDTALFNLWLSIHNAMESHKHEHNEC